MKIRRKKEKGREGQRQGRRVGRKYKDQLKDYCTKITITLLFIKANFQEHMECSVSGEWMKIVNSNTMKHCTILEKLIFEKYVITQENVHIVLNKKYIKVLV